MASWGMTWRKLLNRLQVKMTEWENRVGGRGSQMSSGVVIQEEKWRCEQRIGCWLVWWLSRQGVMVRGDSTEGLSLFRREANFAGAAISQWRGERVQSI